MKVETGELFAKEYSHFPDIDREKIRAFVAHVEQHGLEGLLGRNKSSDNVPTNDPNWSNKVKYAQQYQLWHYHIGIPSYRTATNGDQVSEYVLHYMRYEDSITLVELSPHPPFTLPIHDYLL